MRRLRVKNSTKDQSLADPVSTSPCIGTCRIDDTTGWCVGCCRTLDEIVGWSQFDAAARAAVLAELADRGVRRSCNVTNNAGAAELAAINSVTKP